MTTIDPARIETVRNELMEATTARIDAADARLKENLNGQYVVCEMGLHNRSVSPDADRLRLDWRTVPHVYNERDALKACADFNAFMAKRPEGNTHPLHVIGVREWYESDKRDALGIIETLHAAQ